MAQLMRAVCRRISISPDRGRVVNINPGCQRDVANSATSAPALEALQAPGSLGPRPTTGLILQPGKYTSGAQGKGLFFIVGSLFGLGAGSFWYGPFSSRAVDTVSLADSSGFPGITLKSLVPGPLATWPESLSFASLISNKRPAQNGFLGPNFIADAAAKAAPAVVNISLHGNGLPGQNGPYEAGSGFIIAPNGTIVTNAHVLGDALDGQNKASRPIMVSLQDERVFEAQIVSFDRVSDLAILKIDADQPLPAAKLGTSSHLRVGEWVLAMGSPLHLQNSVTAGIVSCVDRKAVELGLARAQSDYIQTDAAVNSGNSGGPLVNLCGEVVGISSMKAVSADGVSFAIPMDTAKDIIDQLIGTGRVIRPYIGIKMLQLNSGNVVQLRKRDPSFPNVASGILVPHVTVASPAHKAGLRPGDVITGFAGQSEATTQGLIKALGQHVGKPMELRVRRPSSNVVVVLQVTASEASS